MAIDPVCHMEVDEKTAISRQHDGKTYYFCAEGCAKAFEKNRAQYLSGGLAHGGGGHGHMGHH